MAFVIVNGTVNRVFYSGKGASIKETFTLRSGEEGARYYSAFFDSEHGLEEGATGKFSGLLGTKVNQYEKDGETKYGVDVTLNSARFEAASGEDDTPF